MSDLIVEQNLRSLFPLCYSGLKTYMVTDATYNAMKYCCWHQKFQLS
jgi:hypothetical protein